MINFIRDEVQKRNRDRFYRNNIFNDLKKKEMFLIVKTRTFQFFIFLF